MKSSNVKRIYNIPRRRYFSARSKNPGVYFALFKCIKSKNTVKKGDVQFAVFVLELFDKVEKLHSAGDTVDGDIFIAARLAVN